jgi:hypothetical protein
MSTFLMARSCRPLIQWFLPPRELALVLCAWHPRPVRPATLTASIRHRRVGYLVCVRGNVFAPPIQEAPLRPRFPVLQAIGEPAAHSALGGRAARLPMKSGANEAVWSPDAGVDAMRRDSGAEYAPEHKEAERMRKYLAAVLASAALALGIPSMATAQGQEPRAFGPGGAPAAHGVSGADWGGAVSSAAPSGFIGYHSSGGTATPHGKGGLPGWFN